MASQSQPIPGASRYLTSSVPLPKNLLTGGSEADDDDFQIPPSTQTSQRAPLKSTNSRISTRRPNKKLRQNYDVGKENMGSESCSDQEFGSGNHILGVDLFCSSVTQGCSLDCIPSSIDCSVEDYGGAFRSYGVETDYGQCSTEVEENDGCFKDRREGYRCNSIEARLLGPKIDPGSGGGMEEDDGFLEDGTELDVLMKLCSEENGGEGNSGDGDSGLVQCPLCTMDISALTEEQRQVHSNECLDKVDNGPHDHDDSAKKYEQTSSFMEESVDDPLRLPRQVDDLSEVLIWLRSLGLAKYEDIFIREEIYWDTLQSLTEEDLLSIGIAALGPRKKILNALRELRKSNASSVEAQAQPFSMNNHAIEVQPDDGSSTREAIQTKTVAANKLITEFFPGLAIEGKKVRRTPKEPLSEKGPSNSRGRRADKRHVSNGKSKIVPQWCCIPGTPFRVDAFKYLRGDCCHWFLTHFHLDHYQGLTKSFCHGKIYCSSVTAKLVNMKIGIPWERLQVLQIGQKVNIAGIYVTCFDANHCPGSIMILFEPPNGKATLHTGDFRYTEDMGNWLSRYHIDSLILDTTYCNPQYDFPKQEAVIQFVIESIQAEAFNPKTLFLIGSYTIGKERLFLEVARVLRKKVYINVTKLKILECLGFSKEDMQWFTVNELESHIHVVPMWTLASFKRLEHVARRYKNRFSLIVAFSPTGWTSSKARKKSPGRRLKQGTIIRYEVPYSEHSSFTELKEFVKLVSPERIIPSVNNDGPDSASSMVSLLVS
ncbi:PREDICTED: uncharacterized protein LOC104815085 [Tarenaya hassleriana]|uniref:uncharacterized protein LOC104815085 n=1 Tax=Tarenaya hassleriana TaxID=28532 RepID=UPI00053C0FA9|nr:PREDICTED: uncharacterized protein LOC104815085 [Tarenaya hassleriana]